MKIIKQRQDWQPRSLAATTIGFVPTMGALHAGHAALIQQAKEENACVVVSIFVNPLQFNDSLDYDNYPNTLAADKTLLSKLEVDYLFLPNHEEMYSSTSKFTVQTDHPLAHTLEGAHRSGHFNGVLTIVLKLLNCIQPQNIYFGEKDFQQYRLIEAMVNDFCLNTRVMMCPTVREKSGLALSSRNRRLSADNKLLADTVAALIHTTTAENITEIKSALDQLGVEFDYLNIQDNRVYAAFYINNVRLIDNFALEMLPC